MAWCGRGCVAVGGAALLCGAFAEFVVVGAAAPIRGAPSQGVLRHVGVPNLKRVRPGPHPLCCRKGGNCTPMSPASTGVKYVMGVTIYKMLDYFQPSRQHWAMCTFNIYQEACGSAVWVMPLPCCGCFGACWGSAGAVVDSCGCPGARAVTPNDQI
jgi:hypothetical protein